MCRSGDFNLSFDSLTSKAALQELRNIQKNEPETWARINLRGNEDEDLDVEWCGDDGELREDDENELLDDMDDSSLPVDALRDHIAGCADDLAEGLEVENTDEGLVPLGVAEDPFADDAFDWEATDRENRLLNVPSGSQHKIQGPAKEPEEFGRGKRKRSAPKKYRNDFYLH